MIECIKQQSTEKKQSEASKSQKQVYLLEQAQTVMQWMQDFDPQNVNHADAQVPPPLRHLTKQANQTTREFPKISMHDRRLSH